MNRKRISCFIGLLFVLSMNLSAKVVNDCLSQNRPIGTDRQYSADVVLLVPGTGTRGTILHIGDQINLGGYFDEIQEFFYKKGIPTEVIPADIKGNESIAERAKKVQQWIYRYGFQGKKVLLIGHSLGGLVARVAVRDPGTHMHVSAVVTVSTPNQGTILIDHLEKSKIRPLIQPIAKWIGFDVDKKEFFFQMAVKDAPKWDTDLDRSTQLPLIYSVVVAQERRDLALEFPIFGITDYMISSAMRKRKIKTEWGKLSDGIVPAYSQVWGECLGWGEFSHATGLGKLLTYKSRHKFNRLWSVVTKKLQQKGVLK